VAAAHTAGLAVNTWTVDDPDRIALLVSWGVDAVVTNDVPAAREAVGRR
jgi:glycerophosphoryl diester phosphodiesterase